MSGKHTYPNHLLTFPEPLSQWLADWDFRYHLVVSPPVPVGPRTARASLRRVGSVAKRFSWSVVLEYSNAVVMEQNVVRDTLHLAARLYENGPIPQVRGLRLFVPVFYTAKAFFTKKEIAGLRRALRKVRRAL